jgi:hypothetical protein
MTQLINIIDPLKADVFFSFDGNLDENDKINVINLLRPTDYDWILHNEDAVVDIDANVKKMYQKIYLCNELKRKYELDNNFKYDLVIRLRPDLMIGEPIPIDVVKNINKNTVYYPSVNKYDLFTSNRVIGITDQFAFGDSNSMDVYSDAYNYIYPNYTNLLKNNEVQCPASEAMLLYHLRKNYISTVNYYQKFVLYGKRFDFDNMFYSARDTMMKYKYYPLAKCYYQNKKLIN